VSNFIQTPPVNERIHASAIHSVVAQCFHEPMRISTLRSTNSIAFFDASRRSVGSSRHVPWSLPNQETQAARLRRRDVRFLAMLQRFGHVTLRDDKLKLSNCGKRSVAWAIPFSVHPQILS
jgi:hypothetical protein